MLIRQTLLPLLLALVTMSAAATLACSPAEPVSGKEAIVFNDLNWTSAQVQNRIAQYIVEKGYGYPTEVVFGATIPLFQSLRRGDSHVTMEMWLPNQLAVWEEAEAAGDVVAVGESLTGLWQSAFVIPAYVQEEYPELDSVEDLKDDKYKKLFATAETGGKARLVTCLIGWFCEEVNAVQIESYGLSEHIYVVAPGDREIANVEVLSLYERREPWLGYQDSSNDPVLLLHLVRLEEPAYTDECWATTKACAYADATILIATNPELPTRAPDVVKMLGKWDMKIERYSELAVWQIDNKASYVDTAIWWLNNNADIWSGWVTADAAASIRAALAAGEAAEGWPEE